MDNGKVLKSKEDLSDEIEFCKVCCKELSSGEPRYRTNDGVFCTACYENLRHSSGVVV